MEYDGKMDAEVVALCDAMNRFDGIQTSESCCGHGERPFHIWFVATEIDVLPPLLYYFATCHSGVPGWSVQAETDCGMSPVHFMVEGPTSDYAGAGRIAECMNEYFDSGDAARDADDGWDG